jgi:deazaflavin-dependent oxidoreductase (nitroreductase family)
VLRIRRLLVLPSVAIGALLVARTNRREGLRGFVTHRFNPLVMRLGLAGGRISPWAIVEHVGRTSGTTYRTPIYARAAGDHFFARLTYGRDVHWVKNILAAGHCRIQVHGTIFDLDEPAVIPANENPMVPPWARNALASRTYLRLHVLSRVSDTATEPSSRPEMEPATSWDERPREPLTV